MIKPLLVDECKTPEFQSVIRDFEEMVKTLLDNRRQIDALCEHGIPYDLWRAGRNWITSHSGPVAHHVSNVFSGMEKTLNRFRKPQAALDSDKIIRSSRVNANRYWEYPFSIHAGDVLSTPKLTILDAGGGWSLLPMYLASRLKHTVISVDLDPLQMRYFSPGLSAFFQPCPHYQVDDLTTLSFKDNTFDRVFCVSVLEHIEERTDENGRRVNRHEQSLDVTALREMLRVLKPNGLLVVTIEWSEDSAYGRPYTLRDVQERLLAPFRQHLIEDKIPSMDWKTYKENPRRIWHEYYPHRDNFFMSSLGIILRKS